MARRLRQVLKARTRKSLRKKLPKNLQRNQRNTNSSIFRGSMSGWRRKFRIIDGDVLLHGIDLNREAISRAGLRQTEGDFCAAGVAIVGEVNLQWIETEGRIG